jgi:hypothetical protein
MDIEVKNCILLRYDCSGRSRRGSDHTSAPCGLDFKGTVQPIVFLAVPKGAS